MCPSLLHLYGQPGEPHLISLPFALPSSPSTQDSDKIVTTVLYDPGKFTAYTRGECLTDAMELQKWDNISPPISR